MEENDSTGSNAVWAIAFVLIVAIIAGTLYYSGILRKLTTPAGKQDINIKVDAPAAPPPPAPAR